MAKKKTTARDEITAGVLEAVEEAKKAALAGKDKMTLSSGVKIKIVPLPPLLIEAVDTQFPDPPVPEVEVEVHGEKVMQPNPDDPDYIAELVKVGSDKGYAMADLCLLMGVEVKMPKDESWLEVLRLIGIEVGETKAEKKLAYLRSVGVANLIDLTEVTSRVLAMSGVSPVAVDKAAKSLQG